MRLYGEEETVGKFCFGILHQRKKELVGLLPMCCYLSWFIGTGFRFPLQLLPRWPSG